MRLFEISGGLGNQIFQLAVVVSLANTNKTDQFFLDKAWFSYTHRINRKFRLDQIFDLQQLEFHYPNLMFREGNRWSHFAHRCLRKIIRIFGFDSLFQLPETNFWQKSEHLVSGFSLLKPFLVGKLSDCTSSCGNYVLHVRLTDYVDSKYQTFDLAEYMSLVAELFGEHKFCVISDDRGGAEKLLTANSVNFGLNPMLSTESSEFSDFSLALNADVLVCSNSTFSLSAGALGSQRVVLYPRQWSVDAIFPQVFSETSVLDNSRYSLILRDREVKA